MGEYAEEADNALMSFVEKRNLLRELKRTTNVTEKQLKAHYSHTNYPKEPFHVLHQNYLMDLGFSDFDRKDLATTRYNQAKESPVGSLITCGGCGNQFKKKSYQHKFCGRKVGRRSNCKDFLHNWGINK